MKALLTMLTVCVTLLLIVVIIGAAELGFALRARSQVKDTFARQVDLSAIGKAAVHTSGRIQALDSLTSAVIEHISGSHRIGGQSRTFTYFDLLLSGSAYFEKPVIYVHKEPVRERLALAVVNAAPAELRAEEVAWAESFIESGLISPMRLQNRALVSELEVMRRDLIRTAKFVNEIEFALINMQPRHLVDGVRIIPPPHGDDAAPWLTPDEVERLAINEESPYNDEITANILDAWDRFVRGWVDRNAGQVTLASNDLVVAARAANPALYPKGERAGWPWSIDAESLAGWAASVGTIMAMLGLMVLGVVQGSRRIAMLGGWLSGTLIVLHAGALILGLFNPFALESFYFEHYVRVNEIWILYLLSVAILLMAIVYRWEWARTAGLTIFAAAFALHSAALLLRWYVADRWPNSNMFEAVTTAAWFGGCGALILETLVRRTGMRNLFALGSAAASMTAFMAAHFLPQYLNAAISNKMPVLNDIWLYIHTNVIIFSYVLIFMACVVALLYLANRFVLMIRGRDGAAEFARIGGTATLIGGSSSSSKTTIGQVFDGATMVLVELSFILLWSGIVMGAMWADHSWGRPWGWDPKEVFALNTFIVFLVLVHVRLKAKDKGLWTSILTVAGCLVMLFNWIFINFKISGLHSYA